MDGIDWAGMLLPDTPLLEIFVRGTVMYLGIFLLLRFVMRREAGALGLADLLVIVLIADAAQNGMAADYHSLADGLLLVAVIVGWSTVLDWLAYRYEFWRKVMNPPRVKLISDGRILKRNLDREKITEEELLQELRNHGIDRVDKVRAAYMESDGMVSVIKRGGGEVDTGRSQKGGQGAG